MQNSRILIILTILGGLLLSACGAPEPAPTPTRSVDQIQTEAVSTFAAGLTLTAFANPTATATPTPSFTPFPTATIGLPAGTSASTIGGTAVDNCYRLAYVRDVTVPDNTAMTPGQSFTKTWEVQNGGTCAWEAGFKFTLIGGDAMGGQTLSLSQTVSAGSSTQLSVPMTAPSNKTGTIQGTWRMSTATGTYFGDGLTVVIVIGGASGSATATTGAATSTPTITSTP